MSIPTREQLMITGVVFAIAFAVFGFGSLSRTTVSRAVEPEIVYTDSTDESSRVYIAMRDDVADAVFASDEFRVRALLETLRVSVERSSVELHDNVFQQRLFIIDYLLHNRVFDVSVLGELDAVFD